eukprot:CAMPEP_0114556464 /NCGR_PEP_ID=MMETSP0114-20121206/9305_1 /TAXON_ID=31324 /ORGANISM="Goniomonas sp, Strain m" /LENGTH=169 /DNA_ID=CAMNT_0001741675 /DNA_START=154 /DNA_END=663 /DNA_ORIENTATION=-
MGDAGVGKSCLIKRYCEEKFVSKYISTIGVDFGVKGVMVDGIEVKVNFWDLAGPAEYFEVRNEFYRDSQGAILVYDVGNKKSFDALENWVKEANKFGGGNAIVAVAGNKLDTKKREVKQKEGQAWAAAKGFLFYETSANTGESVSEMFNTLFVRAVRQARAGVPGSAAR